MADASAPVRPRGRWRRWVGLGLIGALAAVSVGTVGVWVWVQTGPGERFVQRQVTAAVTRVMAQGDLTIGALHTNGVDRVQLRDVALRDADGHTVIGARTVDARVRLLPLLLTGRLVVPSLSVDGADVDLHTVDGGLNVAALFPTGDPDVPPADHWLPMDLDVRQVVVTDSRVRFNDYDAEGIDLRAVVTGADDLLTVSNLSVTGALSAPVVSPVTVTGGLTYDGAVLTLNTVDARALGSHAAVSGTVSLVEGPALNLIADVERADLTAVDPLIGAGLQGVWGGRIAAQGPLSALKLSGPLRDLSDTGGQGDVSVTLDLASESLSWRAQGALADLHLDHLLRQITQVIAIDGTVDVSGRGTHWPDDVRVQGHFTGGGQEAYGYTLESLETDFRVSEGVVFLEGLSASHLAADLTGGGHIDVVGGDLDLRLRGPFRPAGLGALSPGASGMGGAGEVDLHLTGNVFADPVNVRFSGTVGVRRFAYTDAVTIDDLRVGLTGQVLGSAVTVRADAVADGALSRGLRVDRLAVPALDVAYSPDTGTVVAGPRAHVEGVSYPGAFRVDVGDGEWSVRVPSEGPYSVDVGLLVGSHSVMDVPGTSGVIDLAIDPEQVGLDVWLSDGPRTTVRTVGAYDLANSVLHLPGLSLSPILGGAWEAVEPVHLRLVDGGVADAAVHLVSPQGDVVVRGALGTRGLLAGDVAVSDLDLAYLSRLVPDLGDLTGTVQASASLTGPAAQVTLALGVEGRVALGERPPVDLTASVAVSGGVAEVMLDTQLDGSPLVSAAGTVPVRPDLAAPGLDPTGDVALTVTVSQGSTDRLAALGVGVPEGGTVGAVLTATGPLRDPRLGLVAATDLPVAGWSTPAHVAVTASRVGEGLVWSSSLSQGDAPEATFVGTATTSLGQLTAWASGASDTAPDWADWDLFARDLDAEVILEGLSANKLGALGGWDGVFAGALHGGVHLAGSPVRPRVTATLDWRDGAIGEVPVTDAAVALTEADVGVALSLGAHMGQDGELRLSGALPVVIDLSAPVSTWTRGTLGLVLSGRDIPVAAVAPFIPGASRPEGTVTLAGGVTGTLTDPRPDVHGRVVQGGLALASSGVRYRNVGFGIAVTPEAIAVTDLSARTEPARRFLGFTEDPFPHRLTGQARVALNGWAPAEVDGAIALEEAWLVALPDTQVRGSGSVTVSGVYPALQVDGTVAVDNALVVQDLASFLSTSPSVLDPRITVHRASDAAAVREVVALEPGLWETMDLHVAVDLARNVQVQVAFPFLDDLGAIGASVTRADVNARLGGNVVYEVHGGQATLVGPVEVLDGNVRVLRTLFTLQDGKATFHGDVVDPILDLSARSAVAGTDVDLAVSGTASAPSLVFSSDTYPDQTQILTLLLTGQAPDALSSDQGAAASQALLGLVLSSVFSGARFGHLSYDPDGTVRIGIPITRSVFFETAFATQAGFDENQFTGQVEWQLAPKVVVEAAVGDQYSWADIFWERRF